MMFSSVLLVLLFFQLVISNFQTFCEKKHFKVNGMSECHPLLTCADLPQITLVKTIGYGAVKHVFLAKWGNVEFAYSVLKNDKFKQDFFEGLKIFKLLSPNEYITQLTGFCESASVILTEYHYFNNANNVLYLLENKPNRINLGLKLCLNYAEILNFLHTSPVGTLVNCDSNGLKKLLSQFLIKSDFSLILNDLDALPEVTRNSSIKCGQEILSDLTTPEQVAKNTNAGSTHIQLGYTDKSDVWKFPNVCEYFLTGSDCVSIQYSLQNMRKKCKATNPEKRPPASYIVKFFQNLC